MLLETSVLLQQKLDRDREIVIGIEQPGRWCHDAMPVGIGVVAEGDLIAVFQPDQSRHRVRAGAVHANLAVMIDGHKRERRIDLLVDDVNVQAVLRIDRLPVRQRSAAQRIDRQLQPGRANRLHVHDALQVTDIGRDEVVLMRAAAS